MPRSSRKVSKETIKAKADKAAKRSAGEEIADPVKPIDPVIVPTARIEVLAPKKRTRGRPTKYTPAVGKAICKMLAIGMSVRKIGRRDAMPRASTIIEWSIDPDHVFSEQFARASAVKFTLMAEEMIDIADDSSNDWMEREMRDGSMAVLLNREALERSRLRLDTRWKILAQALPKFAHHIKVEHSGSVDHLVRPQATGDDHLADLTKRYALGVVSSLNGKAVNGTGTKH